MVLLEIVLSNKSSLVAAASAIFTIALVSIASQIMCRRPRRKIDAVTLSYITNAPVEPKECMTKALNTVPISTDEKTCAEQMRAILIDGALSYRSLETNPEILLLQSKFCGVNESYGALWTRFTVQYNLFGGSIVAMGSPEQREKLYALQSTGALGCFAFTECGAGVLSGAVMETTAQYDAKKKCFVIHSPTQSATKKWISQGVFAEHAVISANLIVEDTVNGGRKNAGPHLFFTRIQNRNKDSGELSSVNKSVTVSTLPQKTALLGLDNAFISFDHFEVPHEALLCRFSSVDIDSGKYSLQLPKGVDRMLDLLISRLLTGRIVLSEYTIANSVRLMRKTWDFASKRELWKGKKDKGKMISELPLMHSAFVDYTRSLAMVAHFIEQTRHRVSAGIREDRFTHSVVEAACICKFVGTSFAVDVASVLRKLMGSQALFAESWLGESSFVANATCAAEGDNTIMELKVVQDTFRGRTQLVPWKAVFSAMKHATGRRVLGAYVIRVATAMWMGKKAIDDNQLLKEMAWCRAHLFIMDAWTSGPKDANRPAVFLESYGDVLARFPMPIQC